MAMPVLVEVPVNHKVAPIPESLRSRIDVDKKSVDDVRAESERMSARSEALREAHISSIRERAARETQRGEEAAARKRRYAEAELRKLESKIETAAARSESRKRELAEKREEAVKKRHAMAEAVLKTRQQTHVTMIKKGIEKASRACAAVANRDKQVAAVVKRTGAQVKHALEVAAAIKEKKDSARNFGSDATEGTLDSPHPLVRGECAVDGEVAALPASPSAVNPMTPRLAVPKFDQRTQDKEQKENKELLGKSPRRQETPRRARTAARTRTSRAARWPRCRKRGVVRARHSALCWPRPLERPCRPHCPLASQAPR